jgi:hypothetical protein
MRDERERERDAPLADMSDSDADGRSCSGDALRTSVGLHTAPDGDSDRVTNSILHESDGLWLRYSSDNKEEDFFVVLRFVMLVIVG